MTVSVEVDHTDPEAIAASCLGTLPPDVLQDVLMGARRVRIGARSALRPVAGRSPHLDLVLSGLVRVQVSSPDGRAMTIRYCRRGELMGVATLYAEAVRPFTIEALTDAELLRLDPSAVVRAATGDPRVAIALLTEASERVMSFVAAFSGHAFRTVRQRIARHLLDLASVDPRSAELTAEISQQDLADAAGTVREVVVRVLRELRYEGCVVTGRRGISIIDPERLSAIATAEER